MSIESIQAFQSYSYIIVTILLCVGLYAYFMHLFRSEKSGRRNYEKYGNLALEDSIDDEILESIPSNSTKKELKK